MDDRWEDDALCAQVSPEPFFPRNFSYDRDVADAKAICAGCTVRRQCLAATPDDDKFSIRGGLTPGDRARLRKKTA